MHVSANQQRATEDDSTTNVVIGYRGDKNKIRVGFDTEAYRKRDKVCEGR